MERMTQEGLTAVIANVIGHELPDSELGLPTRLAEAVVKHLSEDDNYQPIDFLEVAFDQARKEV